MTETKIPYDEVDEIALADFTDEERAAFDAGLLLAAAAKILHTHNELYAHTLRKQSDALFDIIRSKEGGKELASKYGSRPHNHCNGCGATHNNLSEEVVAEIKDAADEIESLMK